MSKVKLFLGLMAAVLVIAACSGGDESPTPTEPPSPTPTQPPFTPTPIDLRPTDVPTAVPTETPQEVAAACPDIIQTAYENTETACSGTGQDEACYGNITVEPEPADLPFNQSGDIVDLASLDGLRLSSMDAGNAEWGISLLRVQAAEGEQANVELILFGNVEIQDIGMGESGGLTSFVFQSGVDDSPCEAAPDSGIMIQTPQGVGEIAFLVNEVSIDLGSTAYLQAQAGDEMRINVVEGQATASSQGQSVVIPAGTRSRVPLGDDGLAAGVPSPPEPYEQIQVAALPVTLLNDDIVIAPALAEEDIPSAIVGSAAVGQESLESTFDSDLDGWSIFQDGTPLEHFSETDAAFVCSTDLGQGIYWYFLAPPQWVGDWSPYHGGSLAFGIRQEFLDSQSGDSDAVIETGQGNLIYNLPQNPGIELTPYEVSLTAETGWTLDGNPVSESGMLAALRVVTAFRIRGEYRSGADSACLDYAAVLLPGESSVGAANLPQPETAPVGEESLESTFDSDLDGWSIFQDGTPLEHTSEGDAAFVCSTDLETGIYWYFLAPSQWSGDWSPYYDGALTFAIRQSAVDSQTNEDDVVIETGQGDLTFDTVGNPGLSFTRYLVPLNAEAGWMLAGDPVSEDEMRAALSSVTALRLRGEFRTGADSACLDYASVLLPGDTESGASGSSQTGSTASSDPNVALGVWQSDYGEITFGMTSSTYTNDSGRMFYEINGNVLSGFWVEGSSAQGCGSEMDGSVYWGRIEFTFNDDFTEFTGLWSYCDAEPTQSWNGRFVP